jgi:hypothetical protein
LESMECLNCDKMVTEYNRQLVNVEDVICQDCFDNEYAHCDDCGDATEQDIMTDGFCEICSEYSHDND